MTFTVPDDGNGDIYSFEIIDVDTGMTFATLSWNGSEYTGSVTIDGAKGDEFTLEAKKTRDSDGVTKRSDNQETITIA